MIHREGGVGRTLVRSERSPRACCVSHGGAKGFGRDLCSGEHGRGSGVTDTI